MFVVVFFCKGPKVISKTIPLASIEEVSEVLCRPPVIWDNLHANDYDQRRLFLGPYDGRSTALIPKLNGVLTNPNCEYGANYVAIHTLAHWSKCGPRIDNAVEVVSFYNPKEALNKALMEWMSMFQSKKRKAEDYLPAKNSLSTSKATEMEQSAYKNDQMLDDEDDSKGRTSSSASSSDMDTTPSHENSLNHLEQPLPGELKNKPFSIADLKVLVDYFYLPHIHGEKGQTILEEFCWLKHNAPGSKALKKHSLDDSCESSDGCSNVDDDDDGNKAHAIVKLEHKREISDGESSDECSHNGSDVCYDNEQV